MTLDPAQQAAVEALQTRLAQLPSRDGREALKRIRSALTEQQQDSREAAIQEVVEAAQRDDTWSDLLTIPDSDLAVLLY